TRLRLWNFSPVEGTPEAGCRNAFRRRTTNARHRTRAHEQTKVSDAGRTVARHRAAPGEIDFRENRRDQSPTGNHHSARRTKRQPCPASGQLRLRSGERKNHASGQLRATSSKSGSEKGLPGWIAWPAMLSRSVLNEVAEVFQFDREVDVVHDDVFRNAQDNRSEV